MHTSPETLQAAAVETLARLDGKTLSPKERAAIPPQEMPSQDPRVRRGNMDEVATGYTPEMARLEAMRCLQCKNAPCRAGCPVNIDIPRFLGASAEGRFDDALATIREASILPAICGRVCPQETQCQQTCTLGKMLKDVNKSVAIGRVERFVADRELSLGGRDSVEPRVKSTGRRVAVIGSGPASITVAADVAREGHAVTLYEAFHKPGGVLVYGIPEFRLPKKIVADEIDKLRGMGVEIIPNFVVGRTRKLQDLLDKDNFDAVFIGTGAGLPKFMDIPGENLVGVFSANEYLTRSNLMKAYDTANAHTPLLRAKKVAVLGGGNVAMDAARTALRLGAEEVHLIYRRSMAEIPARAEEVAHAQEEGVVFHILENAVKILGDENGCVNAIECLRYELGEPDASGRRSPVPIKGSEFTFEVDTVIVAIGNESNPLLTHATPGLATDRHGHIIVDENCKTSLDRVYAGGDIVLGAATVILAMGEGRRAAAAINRLLEKQ
ncbi:MAG: NADPH-dependent glutamate synthase [Kiritimatiellaeota bacterium]|nr:NADPH-dependent glutamate synthase [Kiritimatiellota bacterium]